MIKGQGSLFAPFSCEALTWELFLTSKDIFLSQCSRVHVTYPSVLEQAQREML